MIRKSGGRATLGANTFTGSQTLTDGTVLKWSDVGISRAGGGILAFGNGSAGNASAEIRAGVATFTGLVSTPASATGGAGLRLPHGTAPSSPTNGDLWTTTAGLFARINGVTVGPYTA